MWSGIWRELLYLGKNKWDLMLVTLVPLLIIVIFSSMFYQGKAQHLPIAIVDQDQSQLSRNIEKFLSHDEALSIAMRTPDLNQVEHRLNQNKIWGYVLIPDGAEQRLVQAKDAQIAVVFNQSYFSVGNTISSAMMVSSAKAIADYLGDEYLGNALPYVDMPTPHVKISTLYNPELSYEFYLQPFVIPAILHLLLCCCVAFSVGQEFKFQKAQQWVDQHGVWTALSSKIMVYVLIFSLWTWLWMAWLVGVRGWFVAGQLWIILLAQVLFYTAYALMSATVVLGTQNLSKTFGIIAVYGGSSLSFAGVTLPLNNAPQFTQIWANIIPYTPYAKLQTQQWVMGSPVSVSLQPLLVISLFVLIFGLISFFLLRKNTHANAQQDSTRGSP